MINTVASKQIKILFFIFIETPDWYIAVLIYLYSAIKVE